MDELLASLFTHSNPLGDTKKKSEDRNNPLIKIKDKASHDVEEDIIYPSILVAKAH